MRRGHTKKLLQNALQIVLLTRIPLLSMYRNDIYPPPPRGPNQHRRHRWITGHRKCNRGGGLNSGGSMISLIHLGNLYKHADGNRSCV